MVIVVPIILQTIIVAEMLSSRGEGEMSPTPVSKKVSYSKVLKFHRLPHINLLLLPCNNLSFIVPCLDPHLLTVLTETHPIMLCITVTFCQRQRQEFSFGGYSPGGFREESPPETEEAVCRHCLQIMTDDDDDEIAYFNVR